MYYLYNEETRKIYCAVPKDSQIEFMITNNWPDAKVIQSDEEIPKRSEGTWIINEHEELENII